MRIPGGESMLSLQDDLTVCSSGSKPCRVYCVVPENDTELWGRVLSGDAAAWRLLIGRYQSLVYAVCTRAGLSAPDVADCFQQTWVALYENRRRLREPSRISTWLVTTAKREALRLRHRAQREDKETDLTETPDSAPLPDEVLEVLERQSQLGIALGELDPRCRRLVELFFFAPEEQTYEEIAARLGLASNSLGALRRRCLDRLREILVRNGHMDERNETVKAL